VVGRQVRFRAAPADVDGLQDHLRSVDAVFVPWSAPTDAIETQPDLNSSGLGTPYIVRRQDLGCLRRYFVESQGYWLVEQMTCPLIDWLPGRLDDNPISYGRLHFETTIRQGDVWLPMPPGFVKWADSILGWVRRHWTYEPVAKLYYGAAALETKRHRNEEVSNRG
jgi:hypothetical protein